MRASTSKLQSDSLYATLAKLLTVIFMITCFNPASLLAALVPTDQTAPWEDAGLPNGIPNYSVGVTVTDATYGATGDGTTDDTAAIQAAIDACPLGQAVYLPDGVYRTTAALTLNRGIALRGESMLGTILKMDHSGHGIFMGTYSNSSSEISLSASALRGSTVIHMTATSSKFVVGRIIELKQDNDPNVYQIGYKGYESWTDRQTGMVNEIVAVNGTEITLKFPLLKDYDLQYTPKIRAQSPVLGAGVENLTIDRIVDDPNGTGINIYLYAAMQCWVDSVWSEKAYATHIRLARSLQCDVRGCVINDKWLDAGGQGYGILVQDRSTLNLVEDNSCSRLRHSLVVQTGATANVFGYNFSRDPHSSLCEHCVFSDLSAHGSMANFTLWEGNKVAQLYLDNVHGSNPWNTGFRNYTTRPDNSYPGVHVAETSKWCSMIGNVMGNMLSSGEALTIHTDVVATTLNTGNLNGSTGEAYWDTNYDTILPDSLYLTTKPAFLGSKAWPLYGPTVGVIDTLPAEDRWYALTGTTAPVEAPVATTPQGDLNSTLTPIAYYDCNSDGNLTLTDLSGNGLNGTFSGTTFVANSHDGSDALNFDGIDDVITVADDSILDIDTAITISAWVNPTATTSNQCIIGKNNAYYIYLYNGSNGSRLRFGLVINGSWVVLTSSSSSADLVQANVWTHVAVTYDGAQVTFYVNGDEVSTSALTGSMTTSSKDLEFGTIWNGFRFEGDIDDVALFDTALTDAEIQELYTGEWLTVAFPDSLLTYEFESGSGTTANDTSGNQLDGAIDGATFSTNSSHGNYALEFNGTSDEVTHPDNALLDLSDSITISAWVYTNDATKHQCIIGKNNAYYLYLYGRSNGARLRVGFQMNGSWATYTSSNQTSDMVQSSTWAHVAMTYDGSELITYLNGNPVGTTALSGAIGTSNKDLEIGTIWNGFRFDGLMDQVELYDSALSPTDIWILSQ